MSILPAHHPAYFQVFLSRKAYSSVLYLLASLATGIAAFTFAVTGLSLSAGLAILIIGVPFLLGFLALGRMLAVAELSWLRATVDAELPARPGLLPEGDGLWPRVLALLQDRTTWTAQLYFLILLPLGITYFTLMTVLLTTSLAFMAAPVLRVFGPVALTLDLPLDGLGWFSARPMLSALVAALIGVLLLPATLHLSLCLGRAQAWLASKLLARS